MGWLSRVGEHRPVAVPRAEWTRGVDALTDAQARGEAGGEDHRELDEEQKGGGRDPAAREHVAREHGEKARPGGRRAARCGDHVERVAALVARDALAGGAGADLTA